MMKHFLFLVLSLAISVSVCGVACAQLAQASPPKFLFDMNTGDLKRWSPSSDQVKVWRSLNASRPGVEVTIHPGKDSYPGVGLKPEGMPWNLAAYGHVEARIVNLGSAPLTISLRVDNAGDWHDNPWNTESITIKPGDFDIVHTIFGYSYGYKRGYALHPAEVVHLQIFAARADAIQSFRIESLLASGPADETPPVAPDDVRIEPINGLLFGAAPAPHPPMRIGGQGGVNIKATSGITESCDLLFAAGQTDASGFLGPGPGRWDLRKCLEVHVKVRNIGKTPVTPRVRLETNGGPSDWFTAAPLAAGAETTITIPFISATPADLNRRDSLSKITSDAVAGVTIGAERAQRYRILRVEKITADAPPPPPLPAWLGQRPPVSGQWVKTLDEEFNGVTLDTSLWSVYGDNYWDKSSHWSKNNVTPGSGVVKLRYEKKTGFNNDSPSEKKTDYASGYLHTYDLWAQRYGYFEARMKLPKAPGLWPAFWMMPDRGNRADPQWKRQSTSDGGMEFDIMEHLTRWGPYRYNIAMHYDGYDKDHKSLGSDKIYVQPDKDGFLTCGLLWTPGSAIYYCNGREVLRWQTPRIANVPGILMFTLPVGGWDNSPIEDVRLPDEFVVDYVRVWQRQDLASDTDGRKIASHATLKK